MFFHESKEMKFFQHIALPFLLTASTTNFSHDLFDNVHKNITIYNHAVQNSSLLNQSLENSPYYNFYFLLFPAIIRKRMLKYDHFQELYFDTKDHKKINALFRLHKQAKATIIIFCGWRPGRIERMAPLIPMFNEQEFNLLFVDVRGHGTSDHHSIWESICSFGRYEKEDVIGALEFLKRTVDKPVILWGTCAGAFYAMQALLQLTKQDLIKYYRIKGFIFDSGWASPKEVVLQSPYGYIEKSIPKSAQYTLKQIYLIFYNYFLRTKLLKLDPDVNLYDKIDLIKIPILYIHSKKDRMAYFDPVKKLYHRTKKKYYWWINDGSHAMHQYKYKYSYQNHMNLFCRFVINSEPVYPTHYS